MSIPEDHNVCECNLLNMNKHGKGCFWRRGLWHQAKYKLGLNFDFMHTLEFVPYHTKKFDKLSGPVQNNIIESLPLQLTVGALKEIVEKNKIRYILAVGAVWKNIFDRLHVKMISETKESSRSAAVYVYQFSPESTHIVVYKAGGVYLPSEEFYVKAIRKGYGLSPDYDEPVKVNYFKAQNTNGHFATNPSKIKKQNKTSENQANHDNVDDLIGKTLIVKNHNVHSLIDAEVKITQKFSRKGYVLGNKIGASGKLNALAAWKISYFQED